MTDMTAETKPIIGRIHSFQSLGAVDGPGLRYVVFLQGCPLRCIYCHNPDTWDFSGGEAYRPEEVLRKILRCRSYFEKTGGVTVTGGEPLAQPEFTAELFRLLQAEGIHTALDTSGCGDLKKAEEVLRYTDLVLADIKFLSAADYRQHCHGDWETVEKFLTLTEKRQIPLWVRHVVVPGLTDGEDHIRRLGEIARRYTNLEKIELLPFRTLCLEKYQSMGIPFPLSGTSDMPESRVEVLRQLLLQ